MSNLAQPNDPAAKPPILRSRIPVFCSRPTRAEGLPPAHGGPSSAASHAKGKRVVRRKKRLITDQTSAGYAADDSSNDTTGISFFEQTIAGVKKSPVNFEMRTPMYAFSLDNQRSSRPEAPARPSALDVTPAYYPSTNPLLKMKISMDNVADNKLLLHPEKLESTRLSSIDHTNSTEARLSNVSNIDQVPLNATFVASTKEEEVSVDNTSRYPLSDSLLKNSKDQEASRTFFIDQNLPEETLKGKEVSVEVEEDQGNAEIIQNIQEDEDLSKDGIAGIPSEITKDHESVQEEDVEDYSVTLTDEDLLNEEDDEDVVDLEAEDMEYEEEEEEEYYDTEEEDEEAWEKDCLRMTIFNMVNMDESDSGFNFKGDYVKASDSEEESVDGEREGIDRFHNPDPTEFFHFLSSEQPDQVTILNESFDMDYNDETSTTVMAKTLLSQDLMSQEPKEEARRRASESSMDDSMICSKREYIMKPTRLGESDEDNTLDKDFTLEHTFQGEDLDGSEDEEVTLGKEEGGDHGVDFEQNTQNDETLTRTAELEEEVSLLRLSVQSIQEEDKTISYVESSKLTSLQEGDVDGNDESIKDVATSQSSDVDYEASIDGSTSSSNSIDGKHKDGRGTYVVKKGVNSFRKLPVINSDNDEDIVLENSMEEIKTSLEESRENLTENLETTSSKEESWSDTLRMNERSNVLVEKSFNRQRRVVRSGPKIDSDEEDNGEGGNTFANSGGENEASEKEMEFVEEAQTTAINKDNQIHMGRKLFDIFNRVIFGNRIAKGITLEWNGRFSKKAGEYTPGDDPKEDVVKLSSKILTTGLRLEKTLLSQMCQIAVKRIPGQTFDGWAAKCADAFPILPDIVLRDTYKDNADYKFMCQDLSCGRREESLLPKLDLLSKCNVCKKGYLKLYRLGVPWKRARMNKTTGEVQIVLMES